MKKHRHTTTACCGMLAGALLPLVAGAQQTATLEEVIVTAQKREQRLQDVALSLSVVDESTISDAGVSEVDDVVMLTPGLDFSQTLGRQNTTPLIRGVAPTFLTDPTVVVFTDGFSLGFTRLVNNALLSDLARIEVLKGPQATLYGRNALGGVINYVTKKPSETPGGSISAEYGSYESYQVSGSITGPLVADRLFGRITVGTRSMGGYVDNVFDGAKDVNSERDLSVRGSLRWLASDSLEFDLATTYGKGDDDCGDCSHIPRTYDRLAPDRFVRIGRGELDFNDTELTTNMSFPGSYDREDLTSVLTASYTQPAFVVTSIAGYGRIETTLNGDSNGPGVGSFVPGVLGYTVPVDIEGWSEELRIASNGEHRFTWLTGLYAYRSTADSALNFGPVFLSSGKRTITNYAGFANGEWALTDTFSLAAGLRYDYEKQEFLNKLSRIETTRDAKELLPRLSVSYKPSDRMHLYATASRGYHAGGFNDPRAPRPRFDSEYVWNYEIGLKAGLLDNRMQTQLTAFYIGWDDQQINQTSNTPGGNSVTFIANAGKSEISGLEAALQWSPSDRWLLSTAVSLMDSELKQFQDPIVAPRFGLSVDQSGNELPYAPKVSGKVSAQYLVPIGSGDWELRLRTDTRYMGSRFLEPVNLMEADAYWLANVYAGFQNQHYEIGVYADNVLDEEYLTGGTLPDLVFPAEVTLGTPRMYGLRVSARF